MLAQKIKELRLLRNMSQAELGKKIGVSAKQISYYEAGSREPRLTGLQKLADCFGVTTDYLLGRDNRPQNTSNVPLENEFPTIFKRLRAEKGLSQYEFTVDFNKRYGLDYSTNTISMFENGHRVPTAPVLADYADYYGVTVDYIVHNLKGGVTPDDTITQKSQIEEQDKPINDLAQALFEDRPDVQALLRNGVYSNSDTYTGKDLSQLPIEAKTVLRTLILTTLKSYGYDV